jgi:hypothetical protein
MWVDSGFSFAQPWTDQDELIERARNWDGYVTTTGYLMYEDNRCVVISQSRDGGEETLPGEPRWAACFLINRANILKMEPLIPMSASTGSELPVSAAATSDQPEMDATQAAHQFDPMHARSGINDLHPGWMDTETPEGAIVAQRPAQPAPGDS